jgi:hypothetical protein
MAAGDTPAKASAEAVLLTGVYGAGKTAVVEEIGTVLEERDAPYAALDLDCWPGSTPAGTTTRPSSG